MTVRVSCSIPYRKLLLAAIGLAWLFIAISSGLPVYAEESTQDAGPKGFLFSDYGKVLKTYVNDRGLVNYQGLKKDRKGLDDFALQVSRLDRKIYDTWSDKEKIAFWINVYNGLTLQTIIDRYPIRWSLLKSVIYPRNSIRQISGVWDRLTFRVMGEDTTLDGIEHGKLRAHFNEPRVHMALVCAAMGCPPLRNEPYTADRLDAQLDDQATRFLRNPKKFRIDRENKRVYLSPIFDWFGDDFIKTYGTKEERPGFSPKELAVMRFVSHYVPDSDRGYLSTGSFSVSYLPYDWSLNEQ